MENKEILERARQEKRALGAFNAGSLELTKAVLQAAKNQHQPIIIETSAGEAEHFGMANFLAVVENLRAEAGLAVLTNFDHGPGLEECQRAIKAGYQLVHFDGSDLPYEENVKIAKALVEEAHAQGVLVEGEFDRIPGQSQHHSEVAESVQALGFYTDPAKAADFVTRTGVDMLATFVGNLHGTYQKPPKLDLDRLGAIAQQAGCFLSLHGGSGLLEADVRQAIELGVVKINVNTELRLAYRETLENVLKGSDEVAVYKIMTPVIAAVQKVVEGKIRLFSGQPADQLVDQEKPLVKSLE